LVLHTLLLLLGLWLLLNMPTTPVLFWMHLMLFRQTSDKVRLEQYMAIRAKQVVWNVKIKVGII
jgi:hypothetical protein